MAHKVYADEKGKRVIWGVLSGGPCSTLAEIIEVARKEFPGIPYAKLSVVAQTTCDNGLLQLAQK